MPQDEKCCVMKEIYVADKKYILQRMRDKGWLKYIFIRQNKISAYRMKTGARESKNREHKRRVAAIFHPKQLTHMP